MILSGTPVPNERHQQSPNLLIKIPVNKYFSYYAYLTPIKKIWNFSCDKNGLFPPEMLTKWFKCSASIFDQTKSPSFKLTEIWLVLLISCDKVSKIASF